jgi:hypothetical protein
LSHFGHILAQSCGPIVRVLLIESIEHLFKQGKIFSVCIGTIYKKSYMYLLD